MKNNKNGFVLVGTLLLLAIASVLAISGANELVQHTKIVFNQKDYIQCFYQTDGAIMYFRRLLATTPNFAINSQTLNLNNSKLEIVKNANTLTATASCNGGYNQLELKVTDTSRNEIEPQWLIP